MDTIDIQKRIRCWVETRLGLHAMHSHERAMRMLEEACELAQALGVTEDELHRLGHFVWSKPKGSIRQELGGAALTLLACAEGCGEALSDRTYQELRRIENLPPEKFRRRQSLNAKAGIGEPPEAVHLKGGGIEPGV